MFTYALRGVLAKSSFRALITCSLVLMIMSGCAKYRPHPFQAQLGITDEKHEVEMTATRLTELDCGYYFDKKIVAKGYQVIQLALMNKSNRALVLNADAINLNIEPVYRVAESLYYNTAKRVILWCIPALIFWPFIIPATVEGFNASGANKKLKRDLLARAIDAYQSVIVPPRSTLHKVFFVTHENYSSYFTVTLKDDKTGEKISFDLDV